MSWVVQSKPRAQSNWGSLVFQTGGHEQHLSNLTETQLKRLTDETITKGCDRGSTFGGWIFIMLGFFGMFFWIISNELFSIFNFIIWIIFIELLLVNNWKSIWISGCGETTQNTKKGKSIYNTMKLQLQTLWIRNWPKMFLSYQENILKGIKSLSALLVKHEYTSPVPLCVAELHVCGPDKLLTVVPSFWNPSKAWRAPAAQTKRFTLKLCRHFQESTV